MSLEERIIPKAFQGPLFNKNYYCMAYQKEECYHGFRALTNESEVCFYLKPAGGKYVCRMYDEWFKMWENDLNDR